MVNLGMSKYLSEDFIINLLDAHLEGSRGAEHYAYDIIKREIVAAPGSDVVEVKHGHWIVGLDGSYMCSECSRVFRYDIGDYCALCGAKLEYEE
jgi:hypothetical protein